MEVRKWQKKVWLLARYFEVAVPMIFMVLIVQVCSQEIAMSWIVSGVLVTLVCAGLFRELAETICRRQAQDWLANIRHRLAKDEAERLKIQAEELELHICRARTLIPVIVLVVLAYANIQTLSSLVWIVIDAVMVGYIISMLLMARMFLRDIRDKIAKEWHSV